MLSTIIYRSQLTSCVSPERLQALVDHASSKNLAIQVTGILLFDGQHFFQVLEGTMEAVLDVYQRISEDDRHFNLIELMRDYAPARRFGHAGMELFDLRGYQNSSVVDALLNRVTLDANRVKGDRVVKFLRSFVEGRDKEIPRRHGSWSPRHNPTFRYLIALRPTRIVHLPFSRLSM